jgi:hypothetical protein
MRMNLCFIGYNSELTGYLRGYLDKSDAPPIQLTERYLKAGGAVAEKRVTEAGYSARCRVKTSGKVTFKVGHPMNDQRRNEIKQRWQEIDRELAEIAECKTNRPCDPPKREAELLIEQEALEFELGQE